MENKIKSKRVGDVRIFELMGDLTGSFALRGRDAIQRTLQSVPKRNVLFNIQRLHHIDETGIDAVLRGAQGAAKSVLLAGASPAAGEIQAKDSEGKLKLIVSEDDAARFFERELAVPTLDDDLFPERRQFIRLKTVLPLHFKAGDKEGESHEFFAVVTNLSEGGLFAEFIESASEDGMKKNVNPFDLQLMELHIDLGGHQEIEMRGKLIHGDITEGGIGVEFYDMADPDRLTLRDWISRHLTKTGNS